MSDPQPTNLDRILHRVRSYWPEAEITRLQAAYDFARECHGDALRKSGHPYISHPLAVGEILADMEADPPSVIASLLHDVVEDTPATVDDIRERFGDTVAELVDGVTKLTRLSFHSKREQQANNLRKMFLAMAKDIRVILIKFADRLHNMRTLYALEPDKQQAIAEETLAIFAPLAHRLGVWRFKWELEDSSLRYLDPDRYYEIAHMLGLGREERERRIQQVRLAVQERLDDAGIHAQVQGRAKHIYSIARKMQDQDISFEQIADLAAIRIITDSVADCYAALGLVHDLWMPIQDMFTDYIAKGKSNKYQSLHTKVIGPDNQPLEVQIRTWEMHRIAEYGVAAHWVYKESDEDSDGADEQIALLRQVLELETDLAESHEFLEMLQFDLFNDQVFVFTPDGDVVDLPAGAGPIDFAYRIHSEVGHHCVGAKVNGRQAPLTYEFRNGDIAEIVTNASAEPSRDWLEIIKGAGAKSKVRRHLRGKARAENIVTGRESLREALSKQPAALRELVDLGDLSLVRGELGYDGDEDLLAAIGYGDVVAETVVRDLVGKLARPDTLAEEVARLGPESPQVQRKPSDLPVSVDGANGFACRISKCCSPLPGDDITGYITRGTGLTIHRSDCKNLRYHARTEPDRVVPLSWTDNSESTTFRQDIEIMAVDRAGLFSHITAIVSDCGINIARATATTTDSGVAHLSLTMDIHSRRDLQHVLGRLRQLIDVISIRQMMTANDG
jgi:GTP pyrophosphokinase